MRGGYRFCCALLLKVSNLLFGKNYGNLCNLYQTVLAQQECSVNFRTQEQIQDALNDISVLEEATNDATVLYVYPSINFTCDTTIVGWIMAGVDNSVNSTVYPEIHTWRLSFTGQQYMLQNDTTAGIVPTELRNSLYQYNLSSPLSVSKGDVLGIVSRSGSKILPYFFNDANEYFIDTTNLNRTFLTISATTRGNGLFPLVVPLIQGGMLFHRFFLN